MKILIKKLRRFLIIVFHQKWCFLINPYDQEGKGPKTPFSVFEKTASNFLSEFLQKLRFFKKF